MSLSHINYEVLRAYTWRYAETIFSDCCWLAEYEVDFIDFFTRLANLGANIDKEAYLYPVTLNLPKIS